jgi:dihydropteroate synthase
MNLRLEDRNFSWNIGGKLFNIDSPKVMGIVNCTSDSFYSGSRKTSKEAIQQQIEKHISEGADILDIGGYSSRPGAEDISEKEEIERIKIALEITRNSSDIPVSIDTFRSEVACFALENGAHIVNDISAGKLDKNMFKTISKFNAPMILMHMKGSPQTMQSETNYSHLFQEVSLYFSEQIKAAREAGVIDLAIDLGFGFSKTIEQNFELFQQMSDFHLFNLPLLVGVSRKSMIYNSLDITSEEALNGTTALHMAALMKGAGILRVHDVKEAVETVKLFELIR